MELLWLKLKDFRQFQGETPRIQFARTGERNVTVIHGSNGTGKTTILNALTWVLYGTFTDAFAQPSVLVNRNAVSAAPLGTAVSCVVELVFEHNERKYWLTKTRTVLKDRSGNLQQVGDDDVMLQSAGLEGDWGPPIPKTEIGDIIGRVLPEQLHRYFFFDGERIEQLQRREHRAEVVKSTAMLVGELLFTRAIEHLDRARRQLERELKQIGDAETTLLLEDKEKYESERAKIEEQQAQHERNEQGYQAERKEIEAQLRALAAVSTLQELRDQLQRQEQSLTSGRTKNRATLAALIASAGYKPFLSGAVASVRGRIEQLRHSGELPSAIKAQFVQTLLDQHSCLCGRELVPGDGPYELVYGWMKRGGLSDVEESAIRMDSAFMGSERETKDLFDKLDSAQRERAENRQELSNVEKQLDGIREQLLGSSLENVRDLEKRSEEIETAIQVVQRTSYESQRRLGEITEEIERIAKEIGQRQLKNRDQEIAKLRVVAAEAAIKVLSEMRSLRRAFFREDLEARINRIFSAMSVTPYRAVLSEDYALTLSDASGGSEVGASTGESQVLSLSFIGSVIEQAREVAARRDELPGPESSTFPLVMDSPFGNLDSAHRRQVATHMPKLASQVVVLVSKTQWGGEVEDALGQRVGHEYVLTYHTPRAESEVDRIALHGKTYDLVVRDTVNADITEIQEVVG